MEKGIWIFCDASCHPQTGIGFGAFLILTANESYSSSLAERITIIQSANTSSSRMELETLLAALRTVHAPPTQLTIFTDSQMVATLPLRRSKLEAKKFKNKSGELLANDVYYQDFYRAIDELDFKVTKLNGHQANATKNDLDRIFSLVDRAARKALRTHLLNE